jgi:hypothetical protein
MSKEDANRKPLNPRVKISPTGRPYVEIEDLVKSRLERIDANKEFDASERRLERARLRETVVDAAIRRRHAHVALNASIDQGMPIPICHEYDAANVTYESAIDALLAFEAKK